MERCTRVLISDPEERKGKWRGEGGLSGAGLRQGPLYGGDCGAESTGALYCGGTGAGRHGDRHGAGLCPGAAQRLFCGWGRSAASAVLCSG